MSNLIVFRKERKMLRKYGFSRRNRILGVFIPLHKGKKDRRAEGKIMEALLPDRPAA